MFKKKMKAHSRILSNWTAVLLVFLLVAYYVLTLVNTNKITDQVVMIGRHPFPVALAAGEIETGVEQLRNLPERLFYVRSPEMIAIVGNHYQTIDETINKQLEFLLDRYTYQPETTIQLKERYLELREEQKRLLELCSKPECTQEEVMVFFAENMEPILEEMRILNDSIIAGSQTRFEEFERLAMMSRLNTIISATLLILAVLGALAIYLHLLKIKNEREEEMRNALLEALNSAQSANAAKSQFLSSMSHDIRTPMNAIVGMTAIAGMHLDEPSKIKDCLNKIAISSKHLLSLINDVLDMSKIESGKIALNNEEFLLPELVQNFITIIQPQAKAKQIELQVSVGNIECEEVIGDTLRINQVLLNVMSNAVKFTPPGGDIHLVINELPSQYKGYGTYQFIVEDTGVGMSEEFLEKIFNPFERAQTSTISKTEGTGLGMAITKSIVDMMNGQILIASQQDIGTVVTIILHLRLQQAENKEFDFSSLQELRSLVVDDDKDVCLNTTRMLEEIGMRSEWVLTGAEAVEKTLVAHQKQEDYHSVIIDWKMPEMDGLETTRRIRSVVGDEMPIIILTAYDWSDIEEEAKAAGVNAFLAKPLFKSRLYHVMNSVIHLDNKDAEEELPVASITFRGRTLLVEDNAMNMEIAQEFLTHCGLQVEIAWDGVEAVEKIMGAPDGYYALVFMDIQMPHMDGYQAVKRIREIECEQSRRYTPVIAMSANAFSDDVEKAYLAGMNGYITKPISMEEVRVVLRKYLGEANGPAVEFIKES